MEMTPNHSRNIIAPTRVRKKGGCAMFLNSSMNNLKVRTSVKREMNNLSCAGGMIKESWNKRNIKETGSFEGTRANKNDCAADTNTTTNIDLIAQFADSAAFRPNFLRVKKKIEVSSFSPLKNFIKYTLVSIFNWGRTEA